MKRTIYTMTCQLNFWTKYCWGLLSFHGDYDNWILLSMQMYNIILDNEKKKFYKEIKTGKKEREWWDEDYIFFWCGSSKASNTEIWKMNSRTWVRNELGLFQKQPEGQCGWRQSGRGGAPRGRGRAGPPDLQRESKGLYFTPRVMVNDWKVLIGQCILSDLHINLFFLAAK